MADDARPDAVSQTLTNDEALEQLYDRASPNPARLGCPPPDVLQALAKRQRPIGDPFYDHLAECSACFTEVRALQRSPGGAARPSGRLSRWAALAASLVLVVGSVAWLWLARSPEATAVTIDLTNVTVSRSGQSPPASPPIALPRARVSLTLLLPAGYEAGSYELSFVDANNRMHAAGSGHAELRDFVASLAVRLDLRSVPPGTYRLGIRTEPGEWLFVPVTVV